MLEFALIFAFVLIHNEYSLKNSLSSEKFTNNLSGCIITLRPNHTKALFFFLISEHPTYLVRIISINFQFSKH